MKRSTARFVLLRKKRTKAQRSSIWRSGGRRQPRMLVEVEGRRIEIGRPEKWVWFDSRYTILDLAKYYVAVSPWLMPYLEDRPIVYEIYPGTINGPNSFEQDPPASAPRWIKRTRIRGHERTVTYVVVDSPATLVYLVSLFMVTVHVWESTTRA